MTRRGITLIEVIIVLAVFAIASAALWSYAAGVIEQRKINRLSEQMLQLVQNVKGLYSTMQDTSNLSPAVAINARLVPPDMMTTDGTGLTNIYNGQIDLKPSNINDVGIAQFSNIPSNVCLQLIISYLGKNLQTFQQAGLYGLGVGASPTATPNWSVDLGNLPPPRQGVEDACTRTPTVNVDIYFRLGG